MAQAVGKKTQESFFTGTFSSFSVNDIAKAKEFYGKVVSSDYTRNLAPAEVHLRRIYLGNKTLERTQFGPVEDLRKFKIVYNK